MNVIVQKTKMNKMRGNCFPTQCGSIFDGILKMSFRNKIILMSLSDEYIVMLFFFASEHDREQMFLS